MFSARKINDKVVAVLYDDLPVGISLRYSGKKYYGSEECLVKIQNDTLIVNKEVGEKFGIKTVVYEVGE